MAKKSIKLIIYYSFHTGGINYYFISLFTIRKYKAGKAYESIALRFWATGSERSGF